MQSINGNERKVSLNIAVVGAGAAGIVTAKHYVGGGHNVTVYEQNQELGGVWVYTDEIVKNQHGLNIHTAMYKGLRYLFLSVLALFKIIAFKCILHQLERMLHYQ